MVGLRQDEGRCHVIPVVINTCNRLRHLDLLLRSLSGSDFPRDTPVIVVDDASTDHTHEYLTTKGFCKLYDDPMPFPRKAEAWVEHVGDVPNIWVVHNVYGKVHTVSTKPRLGSIRAALFAIQYAFSMYPDAEKIIRLEDDVLVTPNFYAQLARQWDVWDNRKAGILSGFAMRPLSPALNMRNGVAELVRRSDWVGSPCYMISRELFAGPLRRIFGQCKPQRNLSAGADVRLCQLTRNSGMAVGIVLQGVVQHIGISSRAREDEPKTVRIDSTCKPPYLFADEVRNFNA